MINSMRNEKTVGITGASGALGKELTKLFRKKGYKVIGFTHSKTDSEVNLESPNEWIKWECGKESKLKKHFNKIDILILNHGIYNLSRENANYENSIEINALSKFKFLNIFEDIALTNASDIKKEIWINTSEAEILPALNPSYEISKTLIGQLISFKKNLLNKDIKNKSHMYFVHSYEFIPEDKSVISSTTDYSSKIVCSVERDNLFGTQFHPEKSDKIGLKIIDNFLKL